MKRSTDGRIDGGQIDGGSIDDCGSRALLLDTVSQMHLLVTQLGKFCQDSSLQSK